MKRGFTIIEVIVAIGIFGIAVLAILTYFAISTQFSRFARQTTIASNLAQELVEDEIALSYDSLIVGTGAKTNFSSDASSPYYFYQKQVNISLVDSGLNPTLVDVGLKKIDVYIYWTSLGNEKNIQVSTVVCEK